MSFSSLEFLFFFIAVIGGTYFIQHFFTTRVKDCFLLLASYFFYGYWNWIFCFLLLFITFTSYIAAKSTKKIGYIIGIIIPLGILFFFKYFEFLLKSVSIILWYQFMSLNIRIILPVGISFYTFQALSYVIDVHRGKIKAENDFIKLALYLSFFPQLVAGPIVRAADFLPQLQQERKTTAANIKCGIQLFAFGMFKKIVLADHISVFVDEVYRKPMAFHWTTILLAVVSYSIQIYLDFSGYSDMAIGCAKCLGYDFKQNFNLPYISQSVTEFWRRWHISLSTWLKEYLYIPLGGNKKGKVRHYFNLILTMLLGGLWHGADWTFVFWGALNGLALCVDKFLFKRSRKNIFMKIVGIIVTNMFISFTWIFFRADTFDKAWMVIKGIVTFQNGIVQPFFWSFLGIALVILCTIFALIKAKSDAATAVNGFYPVMDLSCITGLVIFFVFIGLILGLAYTGEQPFIYFQF